MVSYQIIPENAKCGKGTNNRGGLNYQIQY